MQNEGQLDPTNLRLLELLKADGRRSVTALGKALGLSRTAVQDRMKRLEAKGIISGYTVTLNLPEARSFQALVSGAILERPCAPTLRWLRGLPDVKKVVSVSGEIDFVMWVTLPDAAALSDFVDKTAADERIGKVSSQIILQTL
ncbi:MAG: Lrp/AsnC family transcriptional regulator [Hyphomicrobiales bacterium]